MKELTPEVAADAVSKLALMAFFPGDSDTRGALIWALLQFVETEEQLDWLVERALQLYARWPGVGEIRALYCSRYKPRDGAETYSETYPRGFPHESRASEMPPLPPGVGATTDAEFEAALRLAAKVKSFPSGKR
jgi:hypothetical protein